VGTDPMIWLAKVNGQAPGIGVSDHLPIVPIFRPVSSFRAWSVSYNRSMVLICAGMPRSASTWSLNVCNRLLRAAYPSASIGSGYSDRLLDWLADERAEHDHFVLKSHAVGDVGLSLLRLGAAKAVYTRRDPYDAIASTMIMFEVTFEVALG